METRQAPNARNPRTRPSALDVIFAVVFAAYWLALVTPVVLERRHPYDGFRDIASARHFLLGGGWSDPAYKQAALWYPPLGPLIVAGVSRATGFEPDTIYLWSQLIVNWMIPAGLYLTVRLAWGPWVGITTTVAFLLAMPWWQEYVVMHIASWQALILAWPVIWLYARAERAGSMRLSAACGTWLGLCCLFHPLVPGIVTMTFAAAGALGLIVDWHDRDAAQRRLARMVMLLGPAALVGVPLVMTFQHGPIVNPFPREYFDHKLLTLRYAGFSGNPWLWAVGALGVVAAIRRWTFLPERLLIGGLVVTVAGQGIAYVRYFMPLELHHHLPILLPHQFQMHFQLLWAICIGLGTLQLLRWLPARVDAFGRGLAYAACLLITGGWGLARAPYHYRSMKTPEEYRPHYLTEAAAWINANTRPSDVIMMNMEMAHLWLSPSTARKVWLLPIGHSNPRVDWFKRLGVAEALTAAADGPAFHALATANQIDYCVFTLHRNPETGAIEFEALRDWIPVFVLGQPQALHDPNHFQVEYDDPRGVSIVRIVSGDSTSRPGGE